jgi:hypothetical protein
MRGVPRVTLAGEEADARNLFAKSQRGTPSDHFWVQARQVVTGGRDDGLFLMVGRKPESAAARTLEDKSDERLALSWQ